MIRDHCVRCHSLLDPLTDELAPQVRSPSEELTYTYGRGIKIGSVLWGIMKSSRIPLEKKGSTTPWPAHGQMRIGAAPPRIDPSESCPVSKPALSDPCWSQALGGRRTAHVQRREELRPGTAVLAHNEHAVSAPAVLLGHSNHGVGVPVSSSTFSCRDPRGLLRSSVEGSAGALVVRVAGVL